MESAYSLDPSQALNSASFGVERAMTELLILLAFHHGASRLEFRTLDGEFRIAEIIDKQAFEFPLPPDSIRAPVFNHLQTIFGAYPGSAEQRELRVGASLGSAKCEISQDNQSAIITFVLQFSPATNLLPVIQRFWRTHAVNRGSIALMKYYLNWKV